MPRIVGEGLQTNTSYPPRGSVWEWVQASLLAANLAWTTLGRGGYLPRTMVITSALTCALLAVHFVARILGPASERGRLHPAGWALVPFLVYAAANVLWVTPVPWLGWFDWFGWFQIIAVFWVVVNGIRSRGPRRIVFLAIMLVGIVCVVLGCYQRFARPEWLMLGTEQVKEYRDRASGPFGNPNSLATFLVLLIPAVGGLMFRSGARETERVWWGWLLMIFLFGLLLTVSRGPWLGFVVALASWPLFARRRSWKGRASFATLIALGAIFGGAVLYEASSMVRERFFQFASDSGERTRPIMWGVAWKLFREHPVAGAGAGSYNILFEKHRPEQFPDTTLWAHQEYLNTLSDYGLVGFVLFFGASGWITWRSLMAYRAARGTEHDHRLVKREHWLDDSRSLQGIGIGLLAFALQLLIDFHLKIPATAILFAVLAAFGVGRVWKNEPAKNGTGGRSGRLVAVLGLGIAVAVGAFFSGKYRAEDTRFRAREVIEELAVRRPVDSIYGGKTSFVHAELKRAVAIDPENGQAWADLAYVASLRAHVDHDRISELGREAESAADHAIRISPVCHEFWIRRGVARDMQGRWLDAGDDFTHAIGVAPGNATAWFYLADHFSRNVTTKGLTGAALEFCLRLDPGNPGGLVLRQRLAIKSK